MGVSLGGSNSSGICAARKADSYGSICPEKYLIVILLAMGLGILPRIAPTKVAMLQLTHKARKSLQKPTGSRCSVTFCSRLLTMPHC